MTNSKTLNDSITVSGFLNNVSLRDQGKSALAYLSIKDGIRQDNGKPQYKSISLRITGNAVNFLNQIHQSNIGLKRQGKKPNTLIQVISGTLSSFQKKSKNTEKSITIVNVSDAHLINQDRLITDSTIKSSIMTIAEHDKIIVSGFLTFFKENDRKTSAISYISVLNGKKNDGSNNYSPISIHAFGEAKDSLSIIYQKLLECKASGQKKLFPIQIESGLLTSYDDEEGETRTYLKAFKAYEIETLFHHQPSIQKNQATPVIRTPSQQGQYNSRPQPIIEPVIINNIAPVPLQQGQYNTQTGQPQYNSIPQPIIEPAIINNTAPVYSQQGQYNKVPMQQPVNEPTISQAPAKQGKYKTCKTQSQYNKAPMQQHTLVNNNIEDPVIDFDWNDDTPF